MARSTGPGKIRVLKLLDSGPPGVLRIPDNVASATSFQAVLYNFDIDGDVLKREHKEWLKEHVVPQLGDPQVKIELRGEASRSGSDAHNLDLSKRRVAQVMSFFRANGPVLANIADTAAGEADAAGRGENDNTEDALVRAVVVKIERSLHRLVPPVFDSFGSPAGFDPGADPPWVV
jgi:outer membrane protein OmpA-like peptidoglycan-associated protein